MQQNIMSTVYSVELQDHGEDGWLATSSDWPEAAGAGETVTEAMRDLMDAIEEAALGRLARGEPLPEPPAKTDKPLKKRSVHRLATSGQVLTRRVPLTPFAAAKVGLRGWAEKHGRGAQAELVRRTGLDKKTIQRVLDPERGGVSTDKMLDVAGAAGLFFGVNPITADNNEGEAA